MPITVITTKRIRKLWKWAHAIDLLRSRFKGLKQVSITCKDLIGRCENIWARIFTNVKKVTTHLVLLIRISLMLNRWPTYKTHAFGLSHLYYGNILSNFNCSKIGYRLWIIRWNIATLTLLSKPKNYKMMKHTKKKPPLLFQLPIIIWVLAIRQVLLGIIYDA